MFAKSRVISENGVTDNKVLSTIILWVANILENFRVAILPQNGV